MKRFRWQISDRGAVGNAVALVLGGTAGAGLLIGGLLGFLGGIDVVDEPAQTAAAATASFYDCPDGVSLGTVTRGDRVFITGQDESGVWIQVRSPLAVSTRAWIRATHVLPDDSIDSFPVLSCRVPVVAMAAPATTTTEAPPTTDTTATTEAPTTTATTAAPPPTNTTVAADTTPPSISNAASSPDTIWEQDGLGITCAPPQTRQSTISAVVTDAGGLANVTATWTDALGAQSVAMSPSGNTYSVVVGPYAAGTWPDGDHLVTVTIRAADGSGNESTTAVNVTVTGIGACFV